MTNERPSKPDPLSRLGEDEAFRVAPLVRHWSELPPADDQPPHETYAVGDEVPDALFPVEARSWREIVAAGDAASDDSSTDGLYGVGPQEELMQRRSPIDAALAVAHETAHQIRRAEDQRIGTANDARRFTLGRLLFVFTLASIVFGIGARFPRPIFAGAAGVAALVTACGSKWLLCDSAVAQLAWWTLMLVYLSTAAFALLGI